MNSVISAMRVGNCCGPAKINRVPGGVTIPPLDRTFCHSRSAVSTLKSASLIGFDGGRAKRKENCELKGVFPAPSPVRHFFRIPIPTAAGLSVSGGAVRIPNVPSVPTGDHTNSTEQTVTNGPATGGSDDFQEKQQHIEE